MSYKLSVHQIYGLEGKTSHFATFADIHTRAAYTDLTIIDPTSNQSIGRLSLLTCLLLPEVSAALPSAFSVDMCDSKCFMIIKAVLKPILHEDVKELKLLVLLTVFSRDPFFFFQELKRKLDSWLLPLMLG